MSIYQPYFNKGPGRYVILFEKDNRLGEMTYARYLMEQHIGRKLKDNEVVHHINSNKTEDKIENLEILTRKEHAIRHPLKIKIENIECPICNKSFSLEGQSATQALMNRKTRNSIGPFCSSICAHKYVGLINSKNPIKIKPAILNIIYE